MKDSIVTNEQIEIASAIIDEEFAEIVEQTRAKERIKDNLMGLVCENGFMMPQFLDASPGMGKSFLLKAMRRAVKRLTETERDGKGRKTIFIESGKNMQTPVTFFTDILMAHLQNDPGVIFIDEFHEAKPGCLALVRDCLEPDVNRSSKRVKMGADGEFHFNPYFHSYVVATNEVDKLSDALKSRFDRISLTNYSDEGIETILFKGLENSEIVFNENSLRSIAECARGSGRDVTLWINSIRRYLAIQGKNTINKKDVAEIIRRRETLPMGVTLNEVKTLILLEKYGPSQLQSLATKNKCSSAEEKSNQVYLYGRGFLTVDGIRKLTQAGRNYLASLRAEGFIPKAEPEENGVAVA